MLQEDIEFKFSLGVVSLVQRLLGRASNRIVNQRHKDNVRTDLPVCCIYITICVLYVSVGEVAYHVYTSAHAENHHTLFLLLQIPRSVPMTPMTPSNEPQFGLPQDDLSIISRFAVASVGSQGTMGLALALGLVSLAVQPERCY